MQDTAPPARRPRARHLSAHEREAQIVARAAECFSEQGFSVSTRDLATHIGITQPLLFRYFPSKEALINRVFEERFFSSWNPLWETWISDTAQPLEQRLFIYLKDYTQTILRNDWIRLFVFAALEDPTLNKRYISLLQERIFRPILTELRTARDLPPAPTALEMELFWGFHSSFFYMGFRRWIYQLDVPDFLDDIIRARIAMLLSGLPVS
ncbi:TetR/AcrR family transcriptional regulator [Novispirillum itersonii]|uniref:TetR/AcrR family transcriptional regulator n=1 Tax=Novispirillum itersonii TaxID=189 RepID=UPI00037B88F0|nr:TetR/AcrR family transcriptional regulator [Novispirillum itersonii]